MKHAKSAPNPAAAAAARRWVDVTLDVMVDVMV